MLLLLPPSETKRPPGARGRPLDLASLSFPGLTGVREQVLDRLAAVSARPDAPELLGVGPSLAGEVARNTRLRSLPTVPVHDLYTGVLYDALGWASLSPGARRRATSRVVVVSALFGALRPRDRVPPYRLAMGVDLPGLGPLARTWRAGLDRELPAAAGPSGLVVDCRSATYAAAWRPGPALGGRTVAVRVVRQAGHDPDGERSVVSHMAKQTRGEVARALLEAGTDPRTPARLAELLSHRWKVELNPARRPGLPWVLEVVLPR